MGQPSRYGYAAEFNQATPFVTGYHKYDLVSGERKAHHLKNGRTGSEASFISKENAQSEDEGYLMSFVHDPESNTSELVILNAQQIEDDPICRIHLPVRVPAGFHGSPISWCNFVDKN